jgi:hypothetical protein
MIALARRVSVMDYDVLVWPEAGRYRWQVVAVGPDGRDAGTVVEGDAPTEDRAVAAGEAAKPREP